MKILTLDDDPISLMMLGGLLRQFGHELVSATTGEDVLKALDKGDTRVVISDWMMPGMDGLELCRRIRLRKGDYVYFILVTQKSATHENRDAAMQAGVDEFLVKPISADDLWMRLHVAERILALTKDVQQLQTLLPICGYCKKVRDDKDYWQQIDSYMQERTRFSFSHGICPDCYELKVVPMLRDVQAPGGEQVRPPPTAKRVE